MRVKRTNEKTLIYVFSGTGNSLEVAKILAENVGKVEIIPIKKTTIGQPVDSTIKKIGFVFPVYYGQPPRMVYDFINAMDLSPDIYYFAIATYGGVGAGAISFLTDFLKRKKIKLAYGNAIKMVRNYILMYNPPSENEKALKKAKEKMKIMAHDIKCGLVYNPRRFRFKANTLYKNIEALDEGFIANEKCISCGNCEQVCPADNIELIGGKPVWKHECERCVACISWCPTRAISYGDKTEKRNVYHNPDITVEEMMTYNTCKKVL